jgi:hypothetical protein
MTFFFLKSIPLWEGCLITGVDTFTFLFLESYGELHKYNPRIYKLVIHLHDTYYNKY